MASNSALIIPPPAPSNPIATTNDIRAIKPPVEIPNPWAWVMWTAGLILALAIVAALVLWMRRQKAAKPAPVIPPHVRARQKLNDALMLINDPRAFCIAVSDAVRVYLEERFQLRAPERTTEEFLRDLQTTTHLTLEQKQSLAAFLEHCDLVKFARFEPTEAALRELHESALRLVHETQYDSVLSSSESTPPPVAPPPNSNVTQNAEVAQ